MEVGLSSTRPDKHLGFAGVRRESRARLQLLPSLLSLEKVDLTAGHERSVIQIDQGRRICHALDMPDRKCQNHGKGARRKRVTLRQP